MSREWAEEIAAGDGILGTPDLGIEILSPGDENSRRDRVAKRQLCGKHGYANTGS